VLAGCFEPLRINDRKPTNMKNTTDSLKRFTASDLLVPWWAVNVPESENDHACCRCGHAVHLEHGSEWLGPDDNFQWNLCNSCAQELVLEMWKRLQDAVADAQRMDALESAILTLTNQAVTASVDMSGKPWRAQFHGERKAARFLTLRDAADSAIRANGRDQ